MIYRVGLSHPLATMNDLFELIQDLCALGDQYGLHDYELLPAFSSKSTGEEKDSDEEDDSTS